MILTKSKIYETRIFIPEFLDIKFMKQEYLRNMKKKDWDWGMEKSAKGDHEKLIDFFITKGANDWNLGMDHAAKGGHERLVHFFISKGAYYWYWGMNGTYDGGLKRLRNFFKKMIK